jgi:hypothetical protein
MRPQRPLATIQFNNGVLYANVSSDYTSLWMVTAAEIWYDPDPTSTISEEDQGVILCHP